MRGQRREIVSIVIHVVAAAGLARAAMASSVMCDDAIAVFKEEQQLRVPVIGRQRPAVAKDDGLSLASVFIIDVDVSAVLFTNCYVWHGRGSFCEVPAGRPAAFRRLHASRTSLSRDFCVTFISSRSGEL